MVVYLLVYSVCRVGADVSAVSSNSSPSMCVCTLPGLLTGCYTLALVGTCRTTVDCLLPSLICCSALSFRWVDLWSFGYAPSVCLATGIVNLYTVMSPPASSGRTAVPQGSSVLRGSGPSRWGRPFGSSLRAFVRTRSDRRFFPELLCVGLLLLLSCF